MDGRAADPSPDRGRRAPVSRYDHVEEMLRERHGVREVIRRRKSDSSRPVSPAMLGELAAVDAVVSGVGD